MLTMQDALARLSEFWTGRGCLVVQPMNTEVGAGTLNPATFLRVLGPEPWRVAYVEPSVRPDDSRYGENPNRVQCHTQFQVILKPEPGDPQELYLASLEALGIDVRAHDVRFVEDNWASPALGAWGLGWEVWLDGLEITQFTYFQQAGGVNLEPVSVEITYGMERILMALQGVRHFKEIAYAPGVAYGEAFGQGEYEMSRYYLDDADVATNRQLLDLYAGEAQRLVDLRLPLPAYSYVLKCSHAFNVLDARGAVSTAERAAEFGRMRRLAAAVAALWIERRTELGHPLLAGAAQSEPEPARAEVAAVAPGAGRPRLLVFEIGTEEIPPGEARSAAEQVERALAQALGQTRLAHGTIRVAATPRRLVATVEEVAAAEPDHTRIVRGPKVAAAFGPDGTPTRAATGFAAANGMPVEQLERLEIGGALHLAVSRPEPGRSAAAALAPALAEVVGALRSGRNMRWRDPRLSFARPIRWLLALWGDEVVPVSVSTLAAGRTTRVLRIAAQPVVAVESAESYADVIRSAGILLDPQERRERIVAGATSLARGVGGRVDLEAESELIDQVAFLVESPSPLVGRFEADYLRLPEAVLATVMRKHQRYLPIRAEDGALLPHFVAVANGPVDEELVRAGNEAVLRARYEDAAFFYRADLETPPQAMRERLSRLTFADRLGSMRDRADRIAALAAKLQAGAPLGPEAERTLARARELVKFDLGSQMVTELTSLAGVMAREYARAAGEPPAVAEALFEAELPRHAGDALPRSVPGAILSLADRLDFLVGLAATVGLPTGNSDPFALRRAALGAVALHRAQPALAGLSLVEGMRRAAELQPVEVAPAVLEAAAEFLARRLEQLLTEEGHPIDRIRALLLHADRPQRVDALLAALAELAPDPAFLRVCEAMQRVRRIVPKGTAPDYDAGALTEPAELRLHELTAEAAKATEGVFDLRRFTKATEELSLAVAEFFEKVFVMVEDPRVRAARLGLLAGVAAVGAHILSWEQLQT